MRNDKNVTHILKNDNRNRKDLKMMEMLELQTVIKTYAIIFKDVKEKMDIIVRWKMSAKNDKKKKAKVNLFKGLNSS